MSFAGFGRRLLQSIATLIGASVLVFVLVRVVPGDPISLLASEALPPEIVEQQRHAFGLDQPLYVQYVLWISHAATGDFGTSYRFSRTASSVILERFPATLELAVVAFTFAVGAGMLMGVLAAVRQGTIWDRALSSIAVVGQGVPIFWLGIMLILIFAVDLRVLPTSGRGGPQYLVLPAFTLATWLMPPIARLTRASVVETLAAQYVTTARAKGLPERSVIVRHALRTALLPVVTILGVQMGNLLSGAIVTEAVFAWPGIGSVMIDAIRLRDYPIVQAAVLYSVFLYVLVNLLVDLLYVQLDPRVAHR